MALRYCHKFMTLYHLYKFMALNHYVNLWLCANMNLLLCSTAKSNINYGHASQLHYHKFMALFTNINLWHCTNTNLWRHTVIKKLIFCYFSENYSYSILKILFVEAFLA